MGCLFPFVRLSARALEACYAKRQKHSRHCCRQALCSNDEGLNATTFGNACLQANDHKQLVSRDR